MQAGSSEFIDDSLVSSGTNFTLNIVLFSVSILIASKYPMHIYFMFLIIFLTFKEFV